MQWLRDTDRALLQRSYHWFQVFDQTILHVLLQYQKLNSEFIFWFLVIGYGFCIDRKVKYSSAMFETASLISQ
jgi:hypothetical protein